MKTFLILLLSAQTALAANQVDTFGIKDAAVTNAKMANMANGTFKCRTSSGTGVPEDCNVSQVNALLNAGTQAVNTVFAGPASGSSAAPTFRAIDGDDLPNPTSSKKGGIISDACLSSNFVTATTTGGDITCRQPAFSDLSGSATTGQMPAHVVYENVASAFTAKIVQSTSPVASTPAMKFTGGVYVSGTATTNTPSVLIEDTSNSSGWSTSGTYFGINSNSLFSGNLLDLQKDGVSKFSVSASGVATGNGSGLTSLGVANLSGAVAIANGGTGQTAKTAAFDALSPNSTLGDVTYHNGTNNVRLAGNTTSTKKYLSQTGTGSVSAAPAWAQPACADLSNAAASCSTDATNASNISSGTLGAARLPNPTTSSLGGTQAITALSHNWMTSINTSGVPQLSQPAFSDISGTATVGQITVGNQAQSTCNTSATIDWSTGNSFTMLLTNGATCAVTFSNAATGQTITIDYTQPASTGSAVVSYVTTVKWAGATTPTMTTGVSKSDTCTFKYNGTDYRGSCIQDIR